LVSSAGITTDQPLVAGYSDADLPLDIDVNIVEPHKIMQLFDQHLKDDAVVIDVSSGMPCLATTWPGN